VFLLVCTAASTSGEVTQSAKKLRAASVSKGVVEAPPKKDTGVVETVHFQSPEGVPPMLEEDEPFWPKFIPSPIWTVYSESDS